MQKSKYKKCVFLLDILIKLYNTYTVSRFMGLGRWFNLVGDAISFCSNTCIYPICTNLEINK